MHSRQPVRLVIPLDNGGYLRSIRPRHGWKVQYCSTKTSKLPENTDGVELAHRSACPIRSSSTRRIPSTAGSATTSAGYGHRRIGRRRNGIRRVGVSLYNSEGGWLTRPPMATGGITCRHPLATTRSVHTSDRYLFSPNADNRPARKLTRMPIRNRDRHVHSNRDPARSPCGCGRSDWVSRPPSSVSCRKRGGGVYRCGQPRAGRGAILCRRYLPAVKLPDPPDQPGTYSPTPPWNVGYLGWVRWPPSTAQVDSETMDTAITNTAAVECGPERSHPTTTMPKPW